MDGDDIVRAGNGRDTLYGDGGNDLLFGGDGDDGSSAAAAPTSWPAAPAPTSSPAAPATTWWWRRGRRRDPVPSRRRHRPRGRDRHDDDPPRRHHRGRPDRDGDGRRPDPPQHRRHQRQSPLPARHRRIGDPGRERPARRPAAIRFADGTTWSGATLAAKAVAGTDAAVSAVLPGLASVLARAPALALPSTVALGTDMAAGNTLGSGTLAQDTRRDRDRSGLPARLLPRRGHRDADVTVRWGGEVVSAGRAGRRRPGPPRRRGRRRLEPPRLLGRGSGGLGGELSAVRVVKLADPGVRCRTTTRRSRRRRISSVAGISRSPAACGRATRTAIRWPTASARDRATARSRSAPTAPTPTGRVRLHRHGRASASWSTTAMAASPRPPSASPSSPGHLLGTDLVVNGSFEDLSRSSGNTGSSDWGYRNPTGTIAGWARPAAPASSSTGTWRTG